MQRILYFFLTGLFLFSKSYGQTNPSDKQILDSLLKNDEMLKMINNYDKASSYFRINIGVGNKLYGNQNKAVSTLQNSSQFLISPSVGYYHKSGLGISLKGDLFSENNKTDFYQYAIAPSYEYTNGKVADASLSYTHYFEKNIYSSNTSPVQDEFYGSLLFKKSWLKPGIAVGYSSGKYHEIINIDTSFPVLTQLIHVNYRDTVTTSLSSFSIVGSIEHSFEFYNIFSKEDGMVFIPQLSLITGINGYQVSHKSTTSNYNAFTKKRLKRIRHFQSQSDNTKYQLQSLGLDLDINYSIGIFYFEPDLYLDYYLPKTKDNKFTNIFNLNIGITF